MKKRYKILIAAVILCLFVVFVYLFMTQDGAMRLAVFMHGYPHKAVVMEYSGTSEMEKRENEIHLVITDPPYNINTDTYEENWIVTRHFGFIYTADCID